LNEAVHAFIAYPCAAAGSVACCYSDILLVILTYSNTTRHVISRSGVVISITNCYIRLTYLLTYNAL